jgi:threonine/homoserine/homoserine lactone efflux protein
MSPDLSLLAFSVLMLGAQFSPGPDMILLTRNALVHSRGAALLTVCGIVLGLAIHCTLILGGVSVVLARSPAAFGVLRVSGAIYLGYLGVRLLAQALRSATTAEGKTVAAALSGREAFTQGLLTNLLNAKAILFLLATLTAFHPPGAPPWRKWALAGIVIGQAVFFWSLFVLALNWAPLRTFFLRRARWIDGVFGVLLIIAAVAAISSWR